MKTLVDLTPLDEIFAEENPTDDALFGLEYEDQEGLITSNNPEVLDLFGEAVQTTPSSLSKALAQGLVAHTLPLTQERIAAFMNALGALGNAAAAAQLTQLSRAALYSKRRSDPAFRQRWDDAMLIGIEAQEDEMRRRAFKGVRRPVFYKGDICGHVVEYSDSNAQFLMKGAKPEIYARERLDVTMKGGLEIKYAELSDKELDEIIMEKLSAVGVRTRLPPPPPGRTIDQEDDDDDE